MASPAAILQVFVNANTKAATTQLAVFDKQLKKTAATSQTTTTTMGGKMAKGTKMAAAGFVAVGVAAVAAGKQLYDLGAQFDDAYDTIRVRTGATGRELEKLKGSFRSVAQDVPNDFQEVGTAIGDLNTRLGLTGKPLERMARNMLHLSNITGDDLEGNIRAVAMSFTDWEVSIPRQTKYLDGLFRLSQKSGASVGQLAESAQKLGSPLRQLGFTFAETAAMFANFERAGVNTQTMMPGLKMAISNLTRPTETLAATMAKLGIEVGKPDKALRQVFEFLGASSNLSQIEKTGLAMDVFGKRAGADMAEAIKQGRFEVDAYLKLFRNNQGDSIRKAADDSYDFSENIKILSNNLKLYLEPAAEDVFVALDNMTRKFNEAIEANREGRSSTNDLAQALQVAGGVLKIIGAAFRQFFKFVGIQFNTAVANVRDFGRAFKFFKATVAENLEAFVRNVRRSFGFFKETVSDNLAKFLQNARRVFRSFKGTVADNLELIKRGFGGLFKAISSVMSKIVREVRTITRPVRSVFQGIVEIVRDKFKSAYNAAVNFVNGIIKVINKIPGVDIGLVGGTGGGNNFGEGSSKRGRAGLQRGGFLMGGKPSGDSIPAMLERGEYVLNREAVKKVGVDRLNKLNFQQAARFQRGGPTDGDKERSGIIGSVGSTVGKAFDLISRGPKALIDLLPNAELPEPISGLAPWLLEQVTEWIKKTLAKTVAGSFSGGSGTYPGVSGDTDFIPALGRALSRMAKASGQSIYVQSGWRSYAEQAALYQAYLNGTGNLAAPPGSSNHESGRAADITPGSEVFGGVAGRFGLGFTVPGESWHIELLQKGGLVGDTIQKMQRGGDVKWKRTGYTVFDDPGGGYLGHLQQGRGYAELGTATSGGSATGTGYLAQLFGMAGELPDKFPLDVKVNGKTRTLYKRDRGYGQGTSAYGIDIYKDSWPFFGLNAYSKGYGHVRPGEGAGFDVKPQLSLKEKRENKIQKLWGAVRSAGKPKEKDQALWKLLSYYAKVSNLGKNEKSDVLNLVRNGKLMAAARYFKKNGKVSGEKGENENFLERLQDAKKWARVKEKREREIAKLWRQYDPGMSPLARYGALWPLLEAYAQYSDIGWKGRDFITNLVGQGAGKESASQAVPFLEKAAHWFTKNGKISGGPANDNFLRRLRKAKGRGQSSAQQQILERAKMYPQAQRLKMLDFLIRFKEEEISLAELFNTSRESASPVMPEGIAPDGTLYTEGEVALERNLNLDLLNAFQNKRSTLGSAIGYLGDLVANYTGRIGFLSGQRNDLLEKAKKAPPPKRKKLLAQAKLLAQEIKNVKQGLTAAKEERGGTDGSGGLFQELETLQGVTGRGGRILDVQNRLKELGYIISDQTPPPDGGGGGGDDTPLTDPTDGADDGRLAEIAEILRAQLLESQRALAISQAQMPIFQQYLPRYHSGGIVGGYQAGGEVPIMAQAGEGIFTRDQMRALSPNPNVTVVIEDGAIDKSKIRVEVDGVLADKISSARRQIPGRSYASR